MKITKRAWGLTLLALAALLFMLWLADLLHFGKTPGHGGISAARKGPGTGGAGAGNIPDLPVLAQVMSQPGPGVFPGRRPDKPHSLKPEQNTHGAPWWP
jgi:hypothetical protein